ncbi:MAG: hypothetical protein VR65_25025 [Desulfobulbaceae bacterium BRH_c16a]|nr:MAG: hypothetical protein VR65_25025 [Desulfobulbaceae bacterium BRH_c16a]
MTTANKIIYEIQAAYTGRGAVKQLGDDLKSLKQVESFQAMLTKFSALSAEFVAAKQKMRELRSEMSKPGNEAMAGEYEKSVGAVNKLAAAIRKQKDILDQQRPVMREAGVNLTDLAGDYDRLKQSVNGLSKQQAMRNLLGVKSIVEVKGEMVGLARLYRETAKAGFASSADQARALDALRKKQRELYATISNPPKLQNARKLLGLSDDADITAQINNLKNAYKTLATSGRASMAQLARAKVNLGKQIDELRGKTSSWRDALGGLRGKAVEVGGAVAGIVLPAREAINYETAMAKVGKVVDGTKQQIDGLGRGLQEMSTRIPMAAGDLASIAAAGGSLGLAVGDIQSFVDVAARMSTAFDMPAQEAGDAIGKLKNIFNLSIPEVETFGDAINKLGNTTAAQEKSIVEVMLRVGGTSQQFGLAKDKTAALAAAMLSLGKTPETAATGINALMNKMQTATMQAEPFQDALAKIGMSAEQMAESVAKDPQKAITDLLETLAKLDKRGQSEVLTGLFGAEYQDDIATLVNGMQTYKDALGQVAEASSYAGAMDEEFRKQSETTGNQLILLKNAVTAIVRNIGTGLLPAIREGAEWLTAIAKKVADLTGKFPGLSGAIVAFVSGAVVLSTVKKIFDVLRMAALSFGSQSVLSFGKFDTASKSIAAGAPGTFGKIGGAAKKLGGVLKRSLGWLSILALTFEAGMAIGTWLNQFGIVQKGMTTLIYWADRLQLGAQRMWRAITGGDTGEIDKNIEIAKQTYKERLEEIDTEVAEEKKAKEEPKEDPKEEPKEEPPPTEPPSPLAEKKPLSREQEAMDTWDKDKLTEEQLKERQERLGTTDSTDEIARKKAEEEKKAAVENKEDLQPDVKEKAEAEKNEEEKKKQVQRSDESSIPSRLAMDRAGQLQPVEKPEEPEEEPAADNKKAEEEEQHKRDREEQDRRNRQFAEEENQKRAATAEQAEKDITQANADRIDAAKQGAEEWAQAENQAVEKAKSVFQKYADKVKSLQDEISGREKSLAQELDELDTKTSAESKWRRRAKEASDYEKAAKAAMKAGDLSKALSLSDQAKELYSSLKGGAGSITAEQARRTALRGVLKTGEMGIDLAGMQKRDAAKQALFAMPPGANELFGDLAGRIRGKLTGIAGGGQGQGGGQSGDQVTKVHELKFKDGALRGGGEDMEAFFRALEQAGLSA